MADNESVSCLDVDMTDFRPEMLTGKAHRRTANTRLAIAAHHIPHLLLSEASAVADIGARVDRSAIGENSIQSPWSAPHSSKAQAPTRSLLLTILHAIQVQWTMRGYPGGAAAVIMMAMADY